MFPGRLGCAERTNSNECAGVAWIKYFNSQDKEPIRAPYDTRMVEIFSVASQAGLVFELVQRKIEGADRTRNKSMDC